jgi:2-keto-4-pentenoate hydratase
MTDAIFDPDLPAQRLAASWQTGSRLVQLPENERPKSLEEAYQAQDAFVSRLDEGIAGWKIAGASPRGLRGELPNAPAIGCLIPSRVVPSGAQIVLPPGVQMTLETEVAFRFKRTVSPVDEELDPASMLDKAFVAMEVVCSRFTDRRAVGQPSFIADNVGFHSLICGDALAWADARVFGEDSGLWKNGERVGASLTGDDRTQPLQSLAFLWDVFSQQGRMIPGGSIVTTGTLCVPLDTSSAGYYEAKVGEATVALTLAG